MFSKLFKKQKEVIKSKAKKKKFLSFFSWIYKAWKRNPKEAEKKVKDEVIETIGELK